jgi:hypothetical protein
MSIRFRRLLAVTLFTIVAATSTIPATAAPRRDLEPRDIPSIIRRIIARVRPYLPTVNEETMSWPKI